MALVYVAVALVATGVATVETQANVQWFSTAESLNFKVQDVIFSLNGPPLDYQYLIVAASLRNPTTYGIVISGASYDVFVNSTSEPFTVAGSSEVGRGGLIVQRSIAGQGSLNITTTLKVLNDTVSPLQNFLNQHSQTDLVVFVGVTLTFSSSYGVYDLSYPCYQLPGNTSTICPPSRHPPSPSPYGGG